MFDWIDIGLDRRHNIPHSPETYEDLAMALGIFELWEITLVCLAKHLTLPRYLVSFVPPIAEGMRYFLLFALCCSTLGSVPGALVC